MPNAGCYARVAPSGEAFLFEFYAEGSSPRAYSPLDALTDNDERQSISLAGNPAGGQFTLAFNGQTTAPIPAIPSPPAVFFQWNPTLASPGQYDLAVDINQGGPYSPNARYDVYEQVGSSYVYLGTKVLNQSGNAGANGGPVNAGMFNDPSLTRVGGGAVQWFPLGTFTTTGTQLRVRLSGPATPADRRFLNADCLRVAPAGGGAATVVSPAAPPATRGEEGESYWSAYPSSYQVSGTGADHWEAPGLGAGTRYLADPAAVRAALEALPGIGAGNVTVTGNGDPRTPLVVSFRNARGGVAQPLIAAADGMVAVARLGSGGLLATFKVNGVAIQAGAPEMRTPYWGTGDYNADSNPRPHAAYLACAYFPLFQAAPAAQFEAIGTGQNTAAGEWRRTRDELPAEDANRGLAGYGEFVRVTDSAAATATYPQKPLPPGQYRVSATWPAAANFSAAVTYAVTNRAGATLGSLSVNQAVAPSGATHGGRAFQVIGTFTLAGLSDDLVVTQSHAAGRMVADAVLFERISPDNSVRIAPGDAVTYSAGAGWARALVGPAPAAVDAPVENLVGVPLYPPLPTTRTMDIGWNLGGFAYYTGSYCYLNIARAIEQLPGLAHDVDGYPTRIANQRISQTINTSPISWEADGKGWSNIDPGDYVLIWDGASNAYLSEAQFGTPQLSGTVNKKRFFHLEASSDSYGVNGLTIYVEGTTQDQDGSWNCDFRNLRIFPILPGVDVDDPPLWHPAHLDRLRGLQCIRAMDPLGGNVGNCATFADYNRPPSQLTRSRFPKELLIPIAEIRAYPTSEIWDPRGGPLYRITTTAPHGLVDGTYISFEYYKTIGLAQWSNGASYDVKDMYGHVVRLSATELLFQFGPATEPPAPIVTMTNVITAPQGGIMASVGSNMAISEIVDMCNEVDCDLHLNLAVTTLDQAVADIGTYLALNLKPGLKVRLAFGNECWNYLLKPNQYVSRQSRRLGLSANSNWVPWYCVRSEQCWDLMAGAMEAAAPGRGADLIRLLETQHADPNGTTGAVAAYCKAHGIAFDEVATAPYYECRAMWTVNDPMEPQFRRMIDLLTPEQLLDFHEMFAVHGGWDQEVGRHRAALDQNGAAGAKIIFYEGGPQSMLPPANDARKGRRSHAVHRHPRYFGFLMHTFRMYQDSGCSLFNLYYLSSVDRGDFHLWSAYTGTTQEPYVPGRPAQDAIQVGQYDRTDLIESVTGGAVLAWGQLPTGAPASATAFSTGSPPASGAVGTPLAVTVTPNGPYPGTITGTPSGPASAGLSPVTLDFAGGATPRVATWTPTAQGALTITWTSSGGLAGPAPLAYQATAAGPGPDPTPAPSGSSRSDVIFAWSPSPSGVGITAQVIPPRSFAVGGLIPLNNAYAAEVAVSFAFLSEGPPGPRPTFEQLLFVPLADIDGTESASLELSAPPGFGLPPASTPTGPARRAALAAYPESRRPMSLTPGSAEPGTTYRRVFQVRGGDFSAFRPAIVNNSRLPVRVTVASRSAT